MQRHVFSLVPRHTKTEPLLDLCTAYLLKEEWIPAPDLQSPTWPWTPTHMLITDTPTGTHGSTEKGGSFSVCDPQTWTTCLLWSDRTHQ